MNNSHIDYGRRNSLKRISENRRADYGRQKSYGARSAKAAKSKAKDNAVFIYSKPKQMDLSLLITVFLLVMFGLVMVFSSSYYAGLTNYDVQDPLRFIKKQGQWAVFGIFAMYFIANFEYRKFKNYSYLFYLVANALLVVVLIFGESINGSKRWLDIGPIGFQPSELAKVATILYLASYLDKNRGILKTFSGFIRCMAIVLVPVVLVAVANLSTAVVILFVGTAMIFIASPVIWYFFAMALPVLGAVVLAVSIPAFAYRLDRLKTWRDPFADATDKGFQTVQSLYAVASGGFFGLGLGQSRQKLGYIPEAYNDIIFSIVCEELGLFGAAALILLFYALIYKGISISMKCNDLFGTLITSGITCMVAIQVIINIAVNTNAMPVTGMPLPFISYGGSSLLIMMCCMGLMLNISKYTRD